MNMSTLTDAIVAADERKSAAIGDAEGPVVYTGGDFSERAIFSGFDIDHDELIDVSRRAASLFANQAMNLPLLHVFMCCWVDALLVGCMIGSRSLSSPTPSGGHPHPPEGQEN